MDYIAPILAYPNLLLLSTSTTLLENSKPIGLNYKHQPSLIPFFHYYFQKYFKDSFLFLEYILRIREHLVHIDTYK